MVAPNIDEILKGVIKETYKENFYLFCKQVLGYGDMNPIHKELCKFIISKHLYKLILMPRFTFKSCIATIGYSLWRLANNPNLRILIYSDAATKAEGFLGSIKNHITNQISGSQFRPFFGDWSVDPKKAKWNESQIVVKVRETAHAEPSVDTGGIETSKIGFHYDLVIFDDIVSDKNITTKAQMDKVADCYKKALSLLIPGGEIMMVGTRWHFGDLYGRIIKENETNNLFQTFIHKAHNNGRYFFDDIGDNSLTKERLRLLKEQQGSAVYSCLYQNDPVSDDTAIFRYEDFSFAEVSPIDLYITFTLDPAGEGEDKTGGSVIGTDNNMVMYILELINKQLKPSEIIDKIVNLHYKYKFKMVGIETNFFRGTLKQDLERRRDEEHTNNSQAFPSFGIHEFLATSRRGEAKHQRILALQPYHERGAIKFPGKSVELLTEDFSELAYQMLQYTINGAKSPHDDILDSLAYHLPLIRKGGVVKTKELPVNSPAWLELQEYNCEIKANARLPRRIRRYVAPLSFS